MDTSSWPKAPSSEPVVRPCSSCLKFSEAWEKIKSTVNAAYGKNNTFLFDKYLQKAIEVLESISRHCNQCSQSFEVEMQVQRQQDKTFSSLAQQNMFRQQKLKNMDRVSAEQDRHLFLSKRTREQVAKLRNCLELRDYRNCVTELNRI